MYWVGVLPNGISKLSKISPPPSLRSHLPIGLGRVWCYLCILLKSDAIGLQFIIFSLPRLLPVDPPSEPRNPQLLQIGPTWVRLRWTPPTNNGSLPLSNYQAIATPQVPTDSSSSGSATASSGLAGTELNLSVPIPSEIVFSNNSSCVEVVCEPSYVVVDAGTTEANVTSLVPSIPYKVVVTALSNGTNLQSLPSTPVNFATEVYGEIYKITLFIDTHSRCIRLMILLLPRYSLIIQRFSRLASSEVSSIPTRSSAKVLD